MTTPGLVPLRPLIKLCRRGVRWRSSIHACQSGRFSVITQPSTSKQAVLDYISAKGFKSPVKSPHVMVTKKSNAAVILASPDLAAWLDDAAFLGSLLHRCSFDVPKDEVRTREVSLLAAVVDGLCPRLLRGRPSSGLSILYGQRDAILPGLWDAEEASEQAPVDSRASVSVALSPLLGDFRALNVTIPLANTLFQNGRRSTLLASRWQSDGNGPFELREAMGKQTQAIIPSLRSIQTHTNASVPLLPVTRPRKIVTGLGNIVRQVEIDGCPSPASKELEVVIPQLLKKRREKLAHGAAAAGGPVAVWALVIPQAAMRYSFVEELSTANIDPDSNTEVEIATDISQSGPNLLGAGCHFHRILSGGGGWGSKQGLLSLDPQTQYSNHGDGDMESFVSSFYGDETAQSIVTPGSFIQFFVEPLATAAESGVHMPDPPPSIVIGTDSGNVDGPRDDAGTEQEPVQIIVDHFSAISHHGIFVDSISPSKHTIDTRGTTHTKIDTPYSYVWEGPRRWL